MVNRKQSLTHAIRQTKVMLTGHLASRSRTNPFRFRIAPLKHIYRNLQSTKNAVHYIT